jgi:hypothetical protein
VRLKDLVNDTFARANNIHVAISEEDAFQENIPNEDDNLEVDVDNMEETIRESIQPVWDGSVINRLQAGIILINMCNLYGVPNNFLDKLMIFLSVDLLP